MDQTALTATVNDLQDKLEQTKRAEKQKESMIKQVQVQLQKQLDEALKKANDIKAQSDQAK